MKLYIIYFSPTGGTKKCADLLAESLGMPVTDVDVTVSGDSLPSLTPADAVVLAVPSFGGRVPAVAAQRLQALQGNGARAVLLCVYGNRAYEDTLVELQDLAEKAGFRVIAGAAAVAEHSIVRQYGAGRPDAADARQLAAFGAKISEKLKTGMDTVPSLPGNRPYKTAGSTGPVPKPTKACTFCGQCAKECPVQAIAPHDPRRVNSDACISCMRCVAICPQEARKVSCDTLNTISLALKNVCSTPKENELFL